VHERTPVAPHAFLLPTQQRLSSHFSQVSDASNNRDCCGGSQHTIHRITGGQSASKLGSKTTPQVRDKRLVLAKPKRPQWWRVIFCTKQKGERLNEPQPTFPVPELFGAAQIRNFLLRPAPQLAISAANRLNSGDQTYRVSKSSTLLRNFLVLVIGI
jgi:hypothetical protein